MVYVTTRGPVCESTDRRTTGGGARGRVSGALPGPKVDIHGEPEKANKVLQLSVAAILKTRLVTKVNFSIEKAAINAHLMGKVAQALENDLINVKIGDSGEAFSHSYSSLKFSRIQPGQKKKIGEIEITRDSFCSGVGKAGIFHECVHALNDVCSYKLTQETDEVFAYLADTLYMMAGKITMPRSGKGAPLYAAAYKIIRTWTSTNNLRQIGL